MTMVRVTYNEDNDVIIMAPAITLKRVLRTIRQTGSQIERHSAVRTGVQAKMGLLSDVQRCSETGTKYRSHQFTPRFGQAATQPADCALLARYTPSSNQTSQPLFWRPSSGIKKRCLQKL